MITEQLFISLFLKQPDYINKSYLLLEIILHLKKRQFKMTISSQEWICTLHFVNTQKSQFIPVPWPVPIHSDCTLHSNPANLWMFGRNSQNASIPLTSTSRYTRPHSTDGKNKLIHTSLYGTLKTKSASHTAAFRTPWCKICAIFPAVQIEKLKKTEAKALQHWVL